MANNPNYNVGSVISVRQHKENYHVLSFLSITNNPNDVLIRSVFDTLNFTLKYQTIIDLNTSSTNLFTERSLYNNHFLITCFDQDSSRVLLYVINEQSQIMHRKSMPSVGTNRVFVNNNTILIWDEIDFNILDYSLHPIGTYKYEHHPSLLQRVLIYPDVFNTSAFWLVERTQGVGSFLKRLAPDGHVMNTISLPDRDYTGILMDTLSKKAFLTYISPDNNGSFLLGTLCLDMSELSNNSRKYNTHTQHIQVFPNPASSVIRLLPNDDVEKIELLNMYGEKVFSSTYRPDNNYELHSLPSGIYSLVITRPDNTTSVQKLVVVK